MHLKIYDTEVFITLFLYTVGTVGIISVVKLMKRSSGKLVFAHLFIVYVIYLCIYDNYFIKKNRVQCSMYLYIKNWVK